MYSYDVFISHASANKRWVEALALNLKNSGYRVFFDTWCLPPGIAIVDGLFEGIKSSRTGVLVISPEAANSGWVSKEYSQMLDHQTRHPEFIIVPVVYGELVEFPFLSNLLWVDFREPEEYHMAFYRLLCGLQGKPPGPCLEPFDGKLTIPGEEAKTPLDEVAEDFFDQIFMSLHNDPIQLLLAQANRAGGPVIQSLLKRAKSHFGPRHVLHLSPPIDPQADADDYFRLLAQQCGFANEVNNVCEFQWVIHTWLASSKPLFLLVSGFENGSAENRRLLAGMLRSLHDQFFNLLKVVVCGSERLAEMKYAPDEDLSLLNIAKAREWPELSVEDVKNYYLHRFNEQDLSVEEANLILTVSGGHPTLLHNCLEQHVQHEARTRHDYFNALMCSPAVYQLFVPLKKRFGTTSHLCDLLSQSDLGNAEPYLLDRILRWLYWKNLLYKNNDRLRWRCEALIHAGKKILECA